MSNSNTTTTNNNPAKDVEGPNDLAHGITHYTYDFPPGTEIVDQSGKEEHIHYPMPTNNLNDPLNWSMFWKFLTFFVFLWYIFWVTFPYIGTSSMYAPLIKELGLSVDAISSFIAWAGFMSGIGNLIWVPAASAFGRRPIILISCAGCFACVLWFGRVSHYRSMLASRIVLGLFMAPIECFAPMQIGDMFFTSQRARAHSVFFIILLISTSIGGAISGAFADSHVGWRGYFYFNAGMVASAFILVLFLMPETAFRRTAASSRGVHGGAEKQAAVSTPELEEDKKEVAAAASADADVESLTVEYVGKGFPNKAQRFGLLAGRDKTYSPFNAWWRVLQAITIWPIWLCIGWFGSIKGILVGQNYVAAQIWQAPPYNFTNAQVGMVNIPAIVGTVTGAIFWGWFSDWDLARRTRNNGGIREPEMRLWPILPGAIIGVIGGVIYGLGAERQWRWEIILIVGNTLNWFGFLSGLVCGLSYAVDSYNRVGGEIGLLMAVFGNAWIFAIGYFVNDMLAKRGFATGIAFLMIPCYAMFFVTILFLIFGKSIRRSTANHPLLK